jgi:hypothetical protein
MATTNSYLGFNLSPTATSGQGAYGLVPGQIGAPVSNWSQLMQNVPGFSSMTSGATGDISSELAGTLSPGTMSTLTNSAASRGISLGQPNSPISNEIGLNLIGSTSEALQNQGLSDYLKFTGTAGGMQLDPTLQADIAQSNATLGSAPDPSQAVNAEQSWIQQYMQMMNPAHMTYNPAGNMGYSAGGMGIQDNAWNYGSNSGYGDSGNPYTVYDTGG